MVEATKPNDNQNNPNVSVQSGTGNNAINLNVKAQVDNAKERKAIISAARGTINALVYNNSKENRQAFSDLLKAVSETDSLKLIKSAKRTIKHEFKSVYKQFAKESPAERVEHMKRLYDYTFGMLEALRSNKAFKGLTDIDAKLAKSKDKANKRMNYHISDTRAELDELLKSHLRTERHLRKKIERRARKLSSMKDELSKTGKHIRELNSEKKKIENYMQPNQYLRK